MYGAPVDPVDLFELTSHNRLRSVLCFRAEQLIVLVTRRVQSSTHVQISLRSFQATRDILFWSTHRAGSTT